MRASDDFRAALMKLVDDYVKTYLDAGDAIDALETTADFVRRQVAEHNTSEPGGKPAVRHPKSYELDGPIGDDGIRRIRRVPQPYKRGE